MVNEYEIKKQICEVGRRIYNRNMVAANDGNISVKLNDNEFLCTPTGVSKGFMTPDFICKVDAQGNVIQANPGFRPSSEIKMHMRVYEKRPDVGSVVHEMCIRDSISAGKRESCRQKKSDRLQLPRLRLQYPIQNQK